MNSENRLRISDSNPTLSFTFILKLLESLSDSLTFQKTSVLESLSKIEIWGQSNLCTSISLPFLKPMIGSFILGLQHLAILILPSIEGSLISILFSNLDRYLRTLSTVDCL